MYDHSHGRVRKLNDLQDGAEIINTFAVAIVVFVLIRQLYYKQLTGAYNIKLPDKYVSHKL